METVTFADWVRGQRTKRRWSQGELARRLDMHRSYISRIEGGVIALPEAETRARFHAVFDTTDADLERLGIVPRYRDAFPRPCRVRPVFRRSFLGTGTWAMERVDEAAR